MARRLRGGRARRDGGDGRSCPSPVEPVRRLDRLRRPRRRSTRCKAPLGSNISSASHRFTDGAEFMPQGTPTNNTESARTDWSRRTPPGPPSLDRRDWPGRRRQRRGAPAAPRYRLRRCSPRCRARRDAEQSRAAAFNTALWTTTWGDAIEHLTPAGRANGDKRLDSPSLDAVRDHWVDNVRGRGPLPALRLGRQPYGVLPIVATDATLAATATAGSSRIGSSPSSTSDPPVLGERAGVTSRRSPTARSTPPCRRSSAPMPSCGRCACAPRSRPTPSSAAMALTLPDLGVAPGPAADHEARC